MSFLPGTAPEPAVTPALTVWVISDAKPGHINQSLGLAEALARTTPTDIHRLPALPAWRAWLAWLLKRLPGPPLPAPDLILGAGHATHLTLLAARRARGGRTVALMKPSLPRRCFDLCILPQHDGIAEDAHSLLTEGAINRIRPSGVRNTRLGLMLIGGKSNHFAWDSDAIQLQIKSILARTPDITGPKKDDICYATQNRQDAVKALEKKMRCRDCGRVTDQFQLNTAAGSGGRFEDSRLYGG